MIPVKNSYDGKDVPSVAVDTNQNDLVPRKKILSEGGDFPAVIEELTVTSNGDYSPEEGVDGFSPVHVNVQAPEPVLDSITITENGTYTPEAPTVGFNEVTVAIPEKEPETVILAYSDYATGEADTITKYKEYSGNCTYQASDGFVNMIYNDNKGQYRHNWLCNQSEKYNYEYIIVLGNVVRGERASNNYLFSLYKNQNTTGGAEIELYWDYTNSVWKLHHSSGHSVVTEIPAQADIFANSETKIFIENNYVEQTSSKKSFVFIQNENVNSGNKLLLHDIGYDWASRYLCIGNKGSNDGFYNIEVVSVKLTRTINHNFD